MAAGDGAALHEDVGAEAREALDAEGEVELVFFLELVLLGVGEDAVAELLGVGGGERLDGFSGTSAPSMRICGGAPVVMWRSDAPFSIISLSSWCRLTMTVLRVPPCFAVQSSRCAPSRQT